MVNNSNRIQTFIQLANKADAFILTTPVFNGSFSSILKNALNYLGRHHRGHKPVGLIATSGSQIGCIQPCVQLRDVMRALHVIVISTQVIVEVFELNEEYYMLKDF